MSPLRFIMRFCLSEAPMFILLLLTRSTHTSISEKMTKIKRKKHLRTLEHIFDFRNQNHEEYISFSKIWTQPEYQKKKKKNKNMNQTPSIWANVYQLLVYYWKCLKWEGFEQLNLKYGIMHKNSDFRLCFLCFRSKCESWEMGESAWEYFFIYIVWFGF